MNRKNGFVVSRCKESHMPAVCADTVPSPTVTLPIPDSLSALLPPHVLTAVLEAYRQQGSDALLEEIRLRAGRKASLTVGGINRMTELILSSSELFSVLTRMCGGSLYSYSENINEGFITLPGGVRVGVVGEATCEGGRVIGVREISALCIRIPHSHPRVGQEPADLLRRMVRETGAPKGILLYAPPGEGKTTLLRGIAARLSGGPSPWRTVVIDTRGELGFSTAGESLCLDVLTGYPRATGISIATRSMNAQVIICDEIGDSRETVALLSAYHGGVPLVATAHAATIHELCHRAGLRSLMRAGIFGAYVGVKRDGQGGFNYEITTAEALTYDL